MLILALLASISYLTPEYVKGLAMIWGLCPHTYYMLAFKILHVFFLGIISIACVKNKIADSWDKSGLEVLKFITIVSFILLVAIVIFFYGISFYKTSLVIS